MTNKPILFLLFPTFLLIEGCGETLDRPLFVPPPPEPAKVVLTPLNDTGVTYQIDGSIGPIEFTKKGATSLDVSDINRPVIFPATNTESNFTTPWKITFSSNGSEFTGENNEPLDFDAPTINQAQQDANNGKDAASTSDNSDGKAGFQFTKLDRSDGSALSNSVTSYGCVKDNITKLMWEHKTSPNSTITLHHSTNKYSWYDPNGNTNGGDAGQINGGGCTIEGDMVSFVSAVNNTNLCGFNDWRIPTIEELRSIVDYEKPIDSYMVDTNFFPEIARISHLWSSQTSPLSAGDAFGFHFHRGSAQPHSKACTSSLQSSFESGVVLVRHTENN